MEEALPLHAAGNGAGRRLAPYLLLAASLHALLILGLKLPVPVATSVAPALHLSWRAPPVPLVPLPALRSDVPPETARAVAPRSQLHAPSVASSRVPRLTISELSVPAATVPSSPSAPAVEPARATAGADLLEGARRMARDIGREAVREGMASGSMAAAGRAAPTAVDRPALPELERALRKRPLGEERLGGGIQRITTESGRVYCLKVPSDFARDGPGVALAVPTNCP